MKSRLNCRGSKSSLIKDRGWLYALKDRSTQLQGLLAFQFSITTQILTQWTRCVDILGVRRWMILTSFDHCTRLLSYEVTALHLDDQDPGQTRASPRTAGKMTWQLCCGMERKLLFDSNSYNHYCTELLNILPQPCCLITLQKLQSWKNNEVCLTYS